MASASLGDRVKVPGGRDAVLVLAARVAMSAQRALVGVVVTIYLAELGFTALQLAAVFALVALTSTAMSAGIGIVADHVGRKPFLVAVPALTAAAGLVFAVTTNVPALVAAAALGAFGRGSGAGGGQIGPYTPAEQALLAGMVTDRQRPTLFGLVASAAAAGGLLGALLVALPVGTAADGPIGAHTYRLAFCVATALAVLAAVVVLPVTEPPLPHRAAARAGRRPPRRSPEGAAPRGRTRLTPHSRGLVLRLWATNATNGVAVGLFGPFVTYWFYSRYGVGTTELGVLYVIVNLVTLFTNVLAAPVAHRFGVVRTVLVARSLQGLLLIPMVFMPSFALAGGLYLLRMMAQRFGMAMRQSFVMSAATPRDRARVAAYSGLPSQGLSAAAPTLTGYLFDAVSLSLPFVLAGALQIVNAVMFYGFFHNFAPPPPERAPDDPAPEPDPPQADPPQAAPDGPGPDAPITSR